MTNKDPDKIPACPYCGSEKLIAIDWGFANWECETCRNNFKTPYYKNRHYHAEIAKRSKKSAGKSKRFKFDKIDEYIALAFWIFCIVFSIIFILVRLYQGFMRLWLAANIIVKIQNTTVNVKIPTARQCTFYKPHLEIQDWHL